MILEIDIPCSVCGYNLRTCSIATSCPECNNSVRDALLNWRLRSTTGFDAAQLVSIRRGALLLICSVMVFAIQSHVFYMTMVFGMQFPRLLKMVGHVELLILAYREIAEALAFLAILMIAWGCRAAGYAGLLWAGAAISTLGFAGKVIQWAQWYMLTGLILPPRGAATIWAESILPEILLDLALLLVFVQILSNWRDVDATRLRWWLGVGVAGVILLIVGFTIAQTQAYFDWPWPGGPEPALWDTNLRFIEPFGQGAVLMCAYTIYRRASDHLSKPADHLSGLQTA